MCFTCNIGREREKIETEIMKQIYFGSYYHVIIIRSVSVVPLFFPLLSDIISYNNHFY